MKLTPGYVSFGDVARNQCGMQSQYCSRYLDRNNTPYLGEGIRTIGDISDYHFIQIHADDVQTFVTRVIAFRKSIHAI